MKKNSWKHQNDRKTSIQNSQQLHVVKSKSSLSCLGGQNKKYALHTIPVSLGSSFYSNFGLWSHAIKNIHDCAHEQNAVHVTAAGASYNFNKQVWSYMI